METKKFRVVFYRPARDGKYVDNLIGSWTRLFNLKAPKELYCSHVEIHTPDETKYDSKMLFRGKSWTSTMGQTGGKNRTGSGVRVRPANEVYKNPERWFYCEFEVPTEVYDQMVINMSLDVQFNKGYDKKMIWSFFGWRSANDKDKYICSEFCFKHLKDAMLSLLQIHSRLQQPDRIQACAIETQIKPTMSPLRGTHTLHKCGVDFFNMDGSLLLAGIK